MRALTDVAGRDRFDRERFDDERAVHEEGVRAPVGGVELGGHRGWIGENDLERGVGAVVAQVRAAGDSDAVRWHILIGQFSAGGLFEVGGQFPQMRHHLGRESSLDGLLTHCDDVGQADAQGR